MLLQWLAKESLDILVTTDELDSLNNLSVSDAVSASVFKASIVWSP